MNKLFSTAALAVSILCTVPALADQPEDKLTTAEKTAVTTMFNAIPVSKVPDLLKSDEFRFSGTSGLPDAVETDGAKSASDVGKEHITLLGETSRDLKQGDCRVLYILGGNPGQTTEKWVHACRRANGGEISYVTVAVAPSPDLNKTH